MADTFTPFNYQNRKPVKMFTENVKPIYSEDNNAKTVGISRMPATAANENMSRMPLLGTANYNVKNVLKRNSPIYKEDWKPEISAAVPEMAAGKPKETVKPIFQGKKAEAANNSMPQAAAPEAKKELGFWDSLFTPKKEGEYSTAREIGTGIANFAEHFGNSLSGTGNAGVTDAWDGIRQEYREKAPNSDISKLYQNTYKKFGIDTAGKSAWDLKRMHPDIKYLQDQKQMEDAQKLALAQAAARGSGGVAAPKKIKLDQKAIAELDDHSNAINSAFATRDLINKLDRSAGGSWLPDLKADTKATAAQIEANRFANARAISGPGAFTETEQQNILPLVPGANERAEVARAKIGENLQAGIKKRMGYLDNLKSQGRIDPEDYERLSSEAAEMYKKALGGTEKK